MAFARVPDRGLGEVLDVQPAVGRPGKLLPVKIMAVVATVGVALAVVYSPFKGPHFHDAPAHSEGKFLTEKGSKGTLHTHPVLVPLNKTWLEKLTTSATTDAAEEPPHKTWTSWNCSLVERVALQASESMTRPWKSCAAKWSVNCSDIGCCAEENMQCYQKDHKWAACMADCNKVNPDDVDDTWTCKVVEPPTPRTLKGCMHECSKTDGCKQAVFSTDEGGHCELSDERSTRVKWVGDNVNTVYCGDPSEQADIDEMVQNLTEKPYQMELDLVTCSWGGEDCSVTKCCNDYICDENYANCHGYACWKKDQYFAGCSAQPAEGWNGTWLGGPREHREVPPAAEGVALQNNRLYCFTVVTWSAPRPKPFWNSEAEITEFWKEQGLHIFQCDGSDIFDGAETPSAGWGSFSNIDMFMNLWQKVGEAGKWRNFDWTVKVDSDAVFLPDRLKSHLWNLRTPLGARVYIENINYKFNFMGAVEILSWEAVNLFLELGHTCIRGAHEGGEDLFLKGCLDGIGIDHQSDWSILRDRYAGINPPCTDGWAAVYHYMKKTRDWAVCYNEAAGANIPVPSDI